MKRNSKRRPRTGTTLIELTITMAIGSVMMTAGMGTLHMLLQTEDVLVDSLNRGQTVSLLSRAFRRDVHAARHAETERVGDNQSDQALILTFGPEHHVKYECKDHELSRVETKSNNTVKSDRFVFSPGTTILLTVEEASRPAIVVRRPNPSSLSRANPRTTAPPRELRFQPSLGRDHRHRQPPAAAKQEDENAAGFGGKS